MKKNRWVKGLSLCLTLVLLLTTVGALSYDFSGDGKTNVWDLQVAINDGKTTEEKNGALREALGGKGDELHKNEKGQWEIWSFMGLQNLMKYSANGDSFILMADLDLKGMEWTPLLLKGEFDGNGHTISNMTITKSVTTGTSQDMGFFAIVDYYTVNGETVQSKVTNLHLENVTITATEDAQYIGLLTGSNRGVIEGCTAIGVINDSRTVLSDHVYVGALAGRNNNSDPLPGTIKAGSNLLTVSAGTDNPQDKVEGVSAKVSFVFAQLDGTNTNVREYGLVGYTSPTNLDQNMIWQDASNATELLGLTEQQRREAVEDKMYQMGTVKWTPSDTVTYTRYDGDAAKPSHIHSDAYIAGKVYTGMPYVGGHNSSYERFMTLMDGDAVDGVYTTKTGLQNGTRQNGTVTGFSQYAGVNCSVAIGWAWASVSPARVVNNDGVIYGGAAVRSAYYMVPNEYNTGKYGTLPVGDYVSPEFDGTKYTYGAASSDTREIIKTNGADKIAECYALAHKGDAITYAQYDYNSSNGKYEYKNSHIRLLAEDPMIIRKADGTIDLKRSYVVTHEQGDGLHDNCNAWGKWETYTDSVGTYNVKYTSWRINHKYTLDILLTEQAYEDAKNAAKIAAFIGTYSNGMQPGCGWGYVPVTMRGFTNDAPSKAPYYSVYPEHTISWPNTGWYYTNYWAISGTMVIKDEAGNEVYNETKYLADRSLSTNFNTIKLEQDFPDAEDNLVKDQTYNITLSFVSSNGVTKTVADNEQFVYTPTTGSTTPDDGETDAD